MAGFISRFVSETETYESNLLRLFHIPIFIGAKSVSERDKKCRIIKKVDIASIRSNSFHPLMRDQLIVFLFPGRQDLDSGVVVHLLPDLLVVDLVDPGWPVLGPVLLPVLRAGALGRLRPVRQLSQILFFKKAYN